MNVRDLVAAALVIVEDWREWTKTHHADSDSLLTELLTDPWLSDGSTGPSLDRQWVEYWLQVKSILRRNRIPISHAGTSNCVEALFGCKAYQLAWWMATAFGPVLNENERLKVVREAIKAHLVEGGGDLRDLPLWRYGYEILCYEPAPPLVSGFWMEQLLPKVLEDIEANGDAEDVAQSFETSPLTLVCALESGKLSAGRPWAETPPRYHGRLAVTEVQNTLHIAALLQLRHQGVAPSDVVEAFCEEGYAVNQNQSVLVRAIVAWYEMHFSYWLPIDLDELDSYTGDEDIDQLDRDLEDPTVLWMAELANLLIADKSWICADLENKRRQVVALRMRFAGLSTEFEEEPTLEELAALEEAVLPTTED